MSSRIIAEYFLETPHPVELAAVVLHGPWPNHRQPTRPAQELHRPEQRQLAESVPPVLGMDL